MEKPPTHGDYANLIRKNWTDREIRQIGEEIEDLERQPGFARLLSLLETRERLLLDRLVLGASDVPVRSTDQIIGTLAGLRQLRVAADSLLYEAHEARERALRAAREADAESETVT